ncbi:hypothetical protein OBBRIDRAFT_625288 [Obba rivulosa]|uniref:Uncharacterized protein n=1 Tax=Obba rivulosa TaxID=1052685 RepID=A0A8E2ATL4_9APHY|nr:hypothetical protein OBBRIDRAFT_625288 [Obba rivulosa]
MLRRWAAAAGPQGALRQYPPRHAARLRIIVLRSQHCAHPHRWYDACAFLRGGTCVDQLLASASAPRRPAICIPGPALFFPTGDLVLVLYIGSIQARRHAAARHDSSLQIASSSSLRGAAAHIRSPRTPGLTVHVLRVRGHSRLLHHAIPISNITFPYASAYRHTQPHNTCPWRVSGDLLKI